MTLPWMLYGANGYTGRLIVEEAVRRGQRPILAGRDPRAIEALAARYDLEFRAFELTDPRVIEAELKMVAVLCLAAGPFSRTSRAAVDACLSTNTHYLDITGEIDTIEAVMQRSDEAESAGISLLPAMGFDVVPTDCLAKKLREALPTATSLELAVFGSSGPSGGTTKTMLTELPKGGFVRSEGRIVPVPFAHAAIEVPFRDEVRTAVSVPWGDVASAYYSTGIGNIVTYLALPAGARVGMRLMGKLGPALGARPAQRLLGRLADLAVKGPDADTRARARMQLWGRVTAPDGRVAEGTLTTPGGYQLTARTAVEASMRAAAGRTRPGAFTPAMAFGSGFITEFGGSDLRAPQSA